MTTVQPRCTLEHRATRRLAIVAHGSAALTAAELAAVRQSPSDGVSPRLGPRFHKLKPQFLKHSEEQTLAALAAVSAALETGEVAHDFDRWSIVSSTRYLARTAFAAVIDKYQVDGPWGVSVQAIPHGTPHAVASTLSLALGIHGPSIGVGAAAGDESQALLSAASLLQNPHWPGAWLLFSAWSSEAPAEVVDSHSKAVPTCIAAALAVVNPDLHTPVNLPVLGQIEFSVGGDEALLSSTEANARATPGLTEFLVGWRRGRGRWHGQAGRGLWIAIDGSDTYARSKRRGADRPRARAA